MYKTWYCHNPNCPKKPWTAFIGPVWGRPATTKALARKNLLSMLAYVRHEANREANAIINGAIASRDKKQRLFKALKSQVR